MRDVYHNLNDAGIVGMMFDYPYTGWPVYGGMDDNIVQQPVLIVRF